MNTSIELRHLRYFVAVAEELHFGRAARRLHLAQPPLSQQIRRLEEIVGHSLLQRTSRAVKLTAAGEVFLDRARRLLQNVEDDLEETRRVGRGELGTLKVGYVSSCMFTSMPGVFRSYGLRYPDVRLQLHEFYTSGVIHNLLQGALDAGFIRDGDPVEGLHIELLYSESYVAAVSVNHRLARRRSISAEQLRDEPFLLFPASAGSRAYAKTLSLCEEHGFRPRVVQEAPHWMSMLRLVGAGLGVTIAPVCVAHIAAPDVVCLPLRGAQIYSDIELAHRTGENRALVAGLTRIAREAFPGRPVIRK